jgi:hypothetical protein
MAPKRKRTASSSKAVVTKIPKLNNAPNPLDSVLAPLIAADKLKINNRFVNDNDKIKNHEVYQQFYNPQWDNTLTPGLEDLAGFIPQQLATINTEQHPISQDKFNTGFDYLNLTKQPYFKDKTRMDFYDMVAGPKHEDQAIRMSPTGDETLANPITTLIHEGTHALDDSYMRTYQKEAINALAKIEPKDPTEWKKWFDEGNWYNQAQNILGIEDFKTNYPYNGINGKENIKRSLSNLTNDYSTDEFNTQNNEEVNNFQSAKKAFEWLVENRPDEAPNSEHFYASLSEFPAFAVQKISEKWNIHNKQNIPNWEKDYWQNNNDGRKFLKGITKGVYKNFRELDPEFSTKYPEANKSFLDRITQLRNYDKERGQTKDGYKEYLYQTKFPQSNPYEQVNPTIPNQNTSSITGLETLRNQYNNQYGDTWSKPAIDHYNQQLNLQNTPWAGVPHPVDNRYYQNNAGYSSTTGSPPPYTQDPYPRIPTPEI